VNLAPTIRFSDTEEGLVFVYPPSLADLVTRKRDAIVSLAEEYGPGTWAIVHIHGTGLTRVSMGLGDPEPDFWLDVQDDDVPRSLDDMIAGLEHDRG
jgi:hypothetical protein